MRSLGLLHYRHQYDDHETFWLGPYVSLSDESDKRYQDHIVPFYYSWYTPEHEGNIFIPLYISYEDQSKYYHVNLGGVSVAREVTAG